MESEDLDILEGKKPKGRGFKIARAVFWGSCVLAFLYGAVWVLFMLKGIPETAEIASPTSFLASQVYSADGVFLGHIHRGEKREPKDLAEISPYVIQALVATEDKRFYAHPGIDPVALPAIAYRYLAKNQVSGASTISMQLARNLFGVIGRDRSVKRKLREIVTAIRLERMYTKSELISLYLNTVNIYGNCYGIETAAYRLFGKSAEELELQEAALIVGLLKGQGTYDPRRRPQLALERRNLVLQLMVDQELVGVEEADQAYQRPLLLASKQAGVEIADHAPYFMARLRLWLEKWGSENGYDVYQDGLQVTTTLDMRLQAHAEAATAAHMARLQKVFDRHIQGKEPWRTDPGMLDRLMRQSDRYVKGVKAGKEKSEIYKEFDQSVPMRVFSWEGEKDTTMTPMDSIKYYSRFLETGMAVVEPGTGHVKAWVGGLDYDYFRYDHVELGKRQTGSTFKPFVYAAAIDNGKKPCDEILNQRQPFDYKDGELGWAPKNVGNAVGGLVNLKLALKYSLNVVTARLTKELGPALVSQYAQRIGIQTEVPPYPASCLGTTELNVLEMTGAYATFVNSGQWVEPIYVSEIRDREGKVIFKAHPKTHLALPDDVAYAMTEMLRAAVGNVYGIPGGLKNAQGKSVAVGGKTGTTQDNSDGWFMGITPELVTGIWVGCSERKMRFTTMKYGQGAYLAKPLFGNFMARAYGDPSLGLGQRFFPKPDGFAIELDCWKTSSKNARRAAEAEPKGLEGWE